MLVYQLYLTDVNPGETSSLLWKLTFFFFTSPYKDIMEINLEVIPLR